MTQQISQTSRPARRPCPHNKRGLRAVPSHNRAYRPSHKDSRSAQWRAFAAGDMLIAPLIIGFLNKARGLLQYLSQQATLYDGLSQRTAAETAAGADIRLTWVW